MICSIELVPFFYYSWSIFHQRDRKTATTRNYMSLSLAFVANKAIPFTRDASVIDTNINIHTKIIKNHIYLFPASFPLSQGRMFISLVHFISIFEQLTPVICSFCIRINSFVQHRLPLSLLFSCSCYFRFIYVLKICHLQQRHIVS